MSHPLNGQGPHRPIPPDQFASFNPQEKPEGCPEVLAEIVDAFCKDAKVTITFEPAALEEGEVFALIYDNLKPLETSAAIRCAQDCLNRATDNLPPESNSLCNLPYVAHQLELSARFIVAALTHVKAAIAIRHAHPEKGVDRAS